MLRPNKNRKERGQELVEIAIILVILIVPLIAPVFGTAIMVINNYNIYAAIDNGLHAGAIHIVDGSKSCLQDAMQAYDTPIIFDRVGLKPVPTFTGCSSDPNVIPVKGSVITGSLTYTLDPGLPLENLWGYPKIVTMPPRTVTVLR